jgi:hypothetical protein
MGTDSQIKADSLKATDRELYTEEISGMLYIVVKKRQ